MIHTDDLPLTNRGTILFAEDNDDLREVTHFFLTTIGYTVVACSDGDQAVEAFRGLDAIDMLLTDFDMPGRNGMELARVLTAIRPTLPVVIVSGSILSRLETEEIERRNWAFISKPCRLPSLLTSLQTAMRPEPVAVH